MNIIEVSEELQALAKEVYDKLPASVAHTEVDKLRLKLIKEQRFLDRYTRKAARRTNEILENYEKTNTDQASKYYKMQLIAVTKDIVSAYRKLIQSEGL